MALEALESGSSHHEFTLKKKMTATIRRWNGRLLIPLYHPSPQVLITN